MMEYMPLKRKGIILFESMPREFNHLSADFDFYLLQHFKDWMKEDVSEDMFHSRPDVPIKGQLVEWAFCRDVLILNQKNKNQKEACNDLATALYTQTKPRSLRLGEYDVISE